MKVKYLILDSAAFINYVPVWEQSENLYCLPEVIHEIKDKKTKQRIESFPCPIVLSRQPNPTSIKHINDFSKKTGDYASLSLTDIKLLALTYEIEVEVKGTDEGLIKVPQRPQTEYSRRPNKDTTPIEGFYSSSENVLDKNVKNLNDVVDNIEEEIPVHKLSLYEDCQVECPGDHDGGDDDDDQVIYYDTKQSVDDSLDQLITHNDNDDNDDNLIEDDPNEEVIYLDNDNDDDDDDDEGWITPSNINKHKKDRDKKVDCIIEDERNIDVACITSDFAMQNVLKHMGLSVMGTDAKMIKHLRSFILRCYACYKTTSIMDKIFCPMCGHKTLKKVSVTVNPDGSQKIWISSRTKINIRGTKFSLPTPMGGKHAKNPILVADQREAHQRASKLGRKKNNPLSPDYDAGNSPFLTRDIYSRAGQLGLVGGGKQQGTCYWEQRNPNVARKASKKKK